MNFKDLKQGYPLFILDRSDMTTKTLKVSNVSIPHVDPKIGGPASLVVDVTTDEGTSFVMVADTETAYTNGKVITTDMQHILHEVGAMKATAEQALREVEQHKQTVCKCDQVLAELDPAAKDKQLTEARFTKLEQGMDAIMGMLQKMQVPVQPQAQAPTQAQPAPAIPGLGH